MTDVMELGRTSLIVHLAVGTYAMCAVYDSFLYVVCRRKAIWPSCIPL